MNKNTIAKLKTLNTCVDKLMTMLSQKQDELRRLEGRSGRGYPLKRINKLRDEIQSVERRLRLAESLQDETLAGG